MNPEPLSVDVEAYLSWLRGRGLSPATVSTYKTQIVSFLGWLGDKPLEFVRLTEYRDWMMEDKPGWRGAEATGRRPRTVGSAFCALKSLWHWLEAQALHHSRSTSVRRQTR